MRELIIIGAGGFGREVAAWVRHCPEHGRDWSLKGFIDDNPDALRGRSCPYPWLGTIKDHAPTADQVFLCAMGVPALKRKCTEIIRERGGFFITLRHPTAVVGDEVVLGPGAILCPYAVISGYSRLGSGGVVNMHSSVAHDATVDNWTQINCHCDLTGGVRVGQEVWFGSHVCLVPGVKIGDRAYLGIGTVVLRDVDPDTNMFGVPARRLE